MRSRQAELGNCEDLRRAEPRLTDLYLAAVQRAVDHPGEWTDVRVFKTETNAKMTADCLAGGFVRLGPRHGDTPIKVRGKAYIVTAASVKTMISPGPDGWLLKIRA
jgi:hypothetical protein